jgi:BirA family biotin operon repressor/biotin-[acetyl-CoA-carboxylase] ligase
LDRAALAARLGIPDLILRHAVTSVLDVLHELAAGGARLGTVVLADRQTKGRGRQGRAWHSPPGRGIWLGYLLRPQQAASTGLVAIRAGLALAAALEDLQVTVGLKWPNDVLLAGRKVGGILGEARWRDAGPAWVAVGIGINVHGPMPEQLRAVAIPIDEVRPVTRVAVLEVLVPRLRTLSVEGELSEQELAAWSGRDVLRDRRVAEPVAGIVQGLDADGALRVAEGSQVRRARAGHVVLAEG